MIHVDEYFIIRNCTIETEEYAIVLEFVEPGRALIVNNTFVGCGIYIWESHDVSIINNNFNEKAGKTSRKNGLTAHHSKSLTIISNNFAEVGLRLYPDYYDFDSYNVSNNKLRDKKIGFYVDVHNQTFSGGFEQIYLFNCTNIKIESQYISFSLDVFFIYECFNCSIVDCTIDNADFGFQIFHSPHMFINNNVFNLKSPEYASFTNMIGNSSFSTISNCIFKSDLVSCLVIKDCNNSFVNRNFVKNGYVGIYYRGYNSIFSLNHIENNSCYGFVLNSGSNNCIYHNNFINNNWEEHIRSRLSQAHDYSGSYNLWWNSTIDEGNFWSDYIGEGRYYLDGSSSAYDPFPLSSPKII